MSLPGLVAAAFALVVTVMIGSLAWLAAAGQSAQLARCPPARVAVVKRFDDLVVYRRPPAARDHAASINVCLRATRRSTRLTYEGYYEDFGGRRALASRGSVVAWVQITRDDGADGDVAVLDIMARDLDAPRDALELFARSNGTRYACAPSGAYCISAAAVSQIVIAADGTVVWIACETEGVDGGDEPIYDKCGPGARSIWAAPKGYSIVPSRSSGPLRELARGASIASRSLQLNENGGRISWIQRHRRRSADL